MRGRERETQPHAASEVWSYARRHMVVGKKHEEGSAEFRLKRKCGVPAFLLGDETSQVESNRHMDGWEDGNTGCGR
jgi:hypothetical protein